MQITPLADKLRPRTLAEVVGQPHLLGKDKVFRRMLESGQIPNMIFYGPSGCGKTTVSRILADNSGMLLHKLNGTSATTEDIRSVVAQVGSFGSQNGVLLYLDEIQYLNKKQQQSLLEFIENGSVTLIASTTENPYFSIYSALLSRCTVFEFKPLQSKDIVQGLENAAKRLQETEKREISFEPGALQKLASSSGGDMRKALNAFEFLLGAAQTAAAAATPPANSKKTPSAKTKTGSDAANPTAPLLITNDAVGQVAQRSQLRYDRDGDEHYDIISAYQKSMRGSDANAALHYLARLLEAGDLLSACRRLLVCAAEDVGLAYPQILPITKAAVDIALQVGLPEASLPLSDAVLMVALAPKSNSAHNAYAAAVQDIKTGNVGPVPRQLQNKHFDGEDAKQKGQHYLYPHEYPQHWVKQQYLPDILSDAQYYTYGDSKTEQAFKAYWESVKNKREK